MFINSILRSLAGVLMLTLNFSALAQEQNAIAPELQVGDSWTYRAIDRWNEKELRQSTVTAIKVSEEAFFFESKRSDREESTRFETTRELNRKTDFGGNYQSNTGWLKFPMKVGNRWTSKDYRRNGNNQLLKDEFEREVVAYERIRVPAGEFDAYKIVGKGFWSGVEFSASGRREQTIWYAPAVKRAVRFEDMGTKPKGGVDWQWREELLEFKLH